MESRKGGSLRSKALRAAREYYDRVLRAAPVFAPGDRIPYGARVFDGEEISLLVDSALDFWLTPGRYAARFETEFARFLGVRHCSLVNSGSSADLLAFMALTAPGLGKRRVGKGDEVISVAAGFPTTVAPIVQFGAVPVFVDIELPGYNIDCSKLERALSRKTKAVMLAHTLGNPFDLKSVRRFCDRHGLWLIEDNCDALGSRFRWNDRWVRTGTVGDISTASFYPSHQMTTGEGGAVCTNDPVLHRIINSLRDWGRDCWCPSGQDNTCGKRFDRRFGSLPVGYDHKYVYSHFGYNLKATEMQAAVGCAQLNKLPAFITARKRNWDLLRQGLADLDHRFVLPEPAACSKPSWFGFCLTVLPGTGFSRDEIVAFLQARNIQTRMLFAGNLTRHPCFVGLRPGKDYRLAGTGWDSKGALPVTDRVMNDTFWIGVYPGLSPEMVSYMIASIRAFAA